jgi:gluconolactonase
MRYGLLCAVTGILAWAAGAGEFEVKDEAEFGKIVPKDATLQKLAGGMKFIEGPVWIAADGGYLVFSDIPADELKKWTAKDGVTTFRAPSHNANGNSLSTDGLLITCEHSARRVTRTEKDGSIAVLADAYDGRKLNSPNDLVMKSDGAIYFTDPPYGVPKGEKKEQPRNYVFRLDPKT